MKFKRNIFILLVLVTSLLAFIPKDENPLDRLASALQKWLEVNPQEKVYLHMDKPYYVVGDTIWFKAYLLTGPRHQLSALSGALYVDLINEKDSIVGTMKLPVSAGMSMGDFVLEDNISEGNYRIRAYTQWMRNAGEEYFFDRTFIIGAPLSTNVLTKYEYQYKTIDGKKILNAKLSYTDDQGVALSNKEVQYEIFIDKERVYRKSTKTDENGFISVDVLNDQNSDLKGAYIKTIIETNEKSKIIKDFPISSSKNDVDIQFFPESGTMINGILSKVAFKITGINGLGLNCKGTIIDNENKEIATIETLNAGMGSFFINPEADKTYSAKMILIDGSEIKALLPKADNIGYVLSIYQPNKDSILVRISTSSILLESGNKDKLKLNFIAQSGGELVMASPLNISKQISSFWIQKASIPSGIVQFTLFSNTGEPLNERIAFIKNNDNMRLKINSGKTIYRDEEQIEIELESKDKNDKMVPGNFSVSIVEESKVPIDEINEHTIFSDLLLTSDLKGYVEKPNYYFSNENEKTNKALDNLMLTQGYRRFIWKQLLENPNKTNLNTPLYPRESLGTNISGVVKSLNGKIVPNAKLTLISTKIGVFETATADQNGRFKFEGLVLTDSIRFTVQARTEKNGSKVELLIDHIPKLPANRNKNISDLSANIPYAIKAYIDNSKKLEEFYEKTGQLSRVQKLKEVNISARKIKQLTYATQGSIRIPDGHSDQTYVINDADKCANLASCLQGQLGGVIFREYSCSTYDLIQNYPNFRNKPMQTIVDGRLITDCEELSGIYNNNVLDPMDIVKIEVIRTNLALMMTYAPSATSAEPIPALFIYTRRGFFRKQYNPSVVNLSPKGFNKAREFYNPRYNPQNTKNMSLGYRSTIYWNPRIKTSSDGKASLSYFNSDGPGKYKVIVEGINADGELGRAIYKYTVEGTAGR